MHIPKQHPANNHISLSSPSIHGDEQLYIEEGIQVFMRYRRFGIFTGNMSRDDRKWLTSINIEIPFPISTKNTPSTL